MVRVQNLWLTVVLSVCALSAVAKNQDGVLKRYEELVASTNPTEAMLALEDKPYFQALNDADPYKAQDLMSHLTALLGLESVISRSRDAHALRRFLWARWGDWYWPALKGSFKAESALPGWVFDHFSEDHRTLWRQAVWDWETLSEAESRWLRENGMDRARWADLSFVERTAYFGTYAIRKLHEFQELKQMPTNEDLDQIAALLHEMPVTPERLEAASGQVYGEQLIRSGLEATGLTVPLWPLLDRASDRTLPMDERLAALNKFFEASGNPQTLLRVAAGPAPERLTPQKRRVLEEMLGRAFTKGLVKISTEMKAFYSKRPLVVVIRDPIGTNAALMQYNFLDDRIIISEKPFLNWLKARGLSEKDILSPEHVSDFEEYVLGRLPPMAHEAAHQMNRHNLKGVTEKIGSGHSFLFPHQEDELTAFLAGAEAFIALLWDNNSKFKDVAEKESSYDGDQWGMYSLAKELAENPRGFVQLVLHEYTLYSDFPTLDEAFAQYTGYLQAAHGNKISKSEMARILNVRSAVKDYYDARINRALDRWIRWKRQSVQEAKAGNKQGARP